MRKVLKVLLIVVLAIIVLVVGLVVTINTPWGKNVIRKQAVSYLQKKLDTKVEIGKIDFSIPNSINLSKVLVLDKRKDTTLWVNQLDVDINMLKLIDGKISVSKLNLEGADVHMYRTMTDTNFNYSFIIDSFVGKKEANTKEVIDSSKKSPIYIDAGLIAIKNSRYRFSDSMGGDIFGISLANLIVKPRIISLDSMRFEVEDIWIDSAQSYYLSGPNYAPPVPDDGDTAVSYLQIVVDKLKLDRSNFSYHDKGTAMYFDINAKALTGAMPRFSLLDKIIKLEYLNVENTNSRILYEKPTDLPEEIAKVTPSTTTEVIDTAENPWTFLVNDLLVKNIAFAFDDNTKPRLASGMDYSHMSYRNFYLTASSLKYNVDTISGIVKNMSLNEKSGLNIQSFRTNFVYHQKGAVLDDLFLKTPQTLLRDRIAVSYRSLSNLSREIGKMRLDVALKQSVLSFKDVFLFLPQAQKRMLADYRNENIRFTLLANGSVEALNIRRLLLKGLHNTEADLYGKIFGLPNTDRLNYDLYVNNLKSTERDIQTFVPASVRRQVDIPTWFAIRGRIKGNALQYNPDLYIRTSDGNARISGALSLQKTGRETYNLYIDAQKLNLGKILKMQDQLGTVTLRGKVKGVGFDPKTMNAEIDALISQAYFRGYNYQNVSAKGFLINQLGDFDIVSRDPNAFLSMKAQIDLRNKYPSIVTTMKVERINLKNLGFIDYDFDLTGDIYANVVSTNPDYPELELIVRDPFVTTGGSTYMLDSIIIYSRPENGFQDIYVNAANMINARLTGKIPLTQIGNAMLAHVNKYYKLSDTISNVPLAYDMNLNGTINYHRLLRKIVPELKPFDTVRFYALIDPLSLNAGLTAPKVRYKDFKLDTFAFSAVEQDNSLMYVASLNKFEKGNIQFFNSSVSGSMRNDSLRAFANLTDAQQRDQFSLGLLTTHDQQDNLIFKLERGLKLNYEDWSVNPENLVVYKSGTDFYVNNLFLQQGNQSIRINSREQVYKSPLHILVNNFAISNLTEMISKDTVLADGTLFVDGDLDLRDTFPKIAAKVRVDSLTLMNSGLGNLNAQVHNQTANAYAVDGSLKGNYNDMTFNGHYYMKPVNGNELDFLAKIHSFNLQSIEGISYGNLKRSTGRLFGDLDIKGTIEKPLVSGALTTDSLKTVLARFNTFMYMPNERILFQSGRGLQFNNFNVFDSFGNRAIINGRLNTNNFREFFMDMSFNANKWHAMNSTQKDNEQIYGKLITTADLNLKGNMTAPAIDGNLRVHDSSDMTYALLDNPALISNEEIVSFYDGRDSLYTDSINRNLDRAKYLLSQSSSLNVNIDIEKGAHFTVLIDPETGDRLNVSGTSFLNANLGPDGSMALTGTYELEDGFYEMNYNFIRKRFKIQKGSIIQLAGDPLDAEVNITATYDANAAPIDLVRKQSDESNDLNYYRQRMPFEVILKMSGNILKPTIGFDIVVKEGGLNTVNEGVKSFVEAKLSEMRNNPSDMNKQVVSLLILGRFVAEDPFTSSSGGGFEYAVRQSASRFLSDQMNRIAGNLVEGLELNLGLNTSEDYSTGSKVNRTDLSVMASKRLFNDRLKITIGNDFALEGQSNVARTSYIPGTLSADYLLTPDGRYIIRGYRSSELQNIVNGYVVETGLSFRLALEYNRFRSLFMSKERYREYLRKRRLEEERKRLEKEKSAANIENHQNVTKK